MKPLVSLKDFIPKHKPPRVVGGDPVREPINMQAALITRKATWIEKPLPPEPEPLENIKRLKEELVSEKWKNLQLAGQVAAMQKKMDKCKAEYFETLSNLKLLIARAEEKIRMDPSDENKVRILRKLKTLSRVIDSSRPD